jgi:hypothetical protein
LTIHLLSIACPHSSYPLENFAAYKISSAKREREGKTRHMRNTSGKILCFARIEKCKCRKTNPFEDED